jgi:hypothetical protein
MEELPSPLLFTLPTDVLTFIFFFLSPKELCCLDSAILNHTDRSLFLSALIQRFQEESAFVGNRNDSLESKSCWYLSRRIPITIINLDHVQCPDGMILLNSNYLKSLILNNAPMEMVEDALALNRCANLKTLKLCDSFPVNFDGSSIQLNLPHLEELELNVVPFSRQTAEIISQHCQSLKSLRLVYLAGVGDEELRILVEGCSSLRSLKLWTLPDITDESVSLLMNHRPRISSIGIRYCRVDIDSVMSLLKETTIPTILNADEDLQIDALTNFSCSIPNSTRIDISDVTELLSHESLLERLVGHLSVRNRVRAAAISFFADLAEKGHNWLVFARDVVPVLVHHCDSFDDCEIRDYLRLLANLSSTYDFGHHLLTSGILSLFRPLRLQLLKVICHPSLSLLILFQDSYFTGTVLVCLSPWISQSLVPIEDWISTVSFLIARCSVEEESSFEAKLHSTIDSICLACTSRSHVRSLVDEGILGYWKEVMQKLLLLKSTSGAAALVAAGGVTLLEAITHLTSIDEELIC